MDALEIPIIDIAPLLAGDPAGERLVADRIGKACRGIGFFYIIGHGISPAVMADVFDMAERFFSSRDTIKATAAYSGTGSNRGYIAIGGEALDPGKAPDSKEAFNIGLDLAADDPDLIAGKPFRALNRWPDLEGFRSVMVAHYDRMWRLGRNLHRAFAIDLKLDRMYFEDKFSKPMAILRLLHYPPVAAAQDGVALGAGAHTDYGNVTLLATDAVGGLMVRSRAGTWLEAPFVPEAFVCNIGDCLMRWTNDIYVSTPHKVVSPVERDRYSVAFFLDPDPDAVVACLTTCVDAQRPARYAAISGEDFLLSRLAPTFAEKTAT